MDGIYSDPEMYNPRRLRGSMVPFAYGQQELQRRQGIVTLSQARGCNCAGQYDNPGVIPPVVWQAPNARGQTAITQAQACADAVQQLQAIGYTGATDCATIAAKIASDCTIFTHDNGLSDQIRCALAPGTCGNMPSYCTGGGGGGTTPTDNTLLYVGIAAILGIGLLAIVLTSGGLGQKKVLLAKAG
jgi:hypothetical protein